MLLRTSLFPDALACCTHARQAAPQWALPWEGHSRRSGRWFSFSFHSGKLLTFPSREFISHRALRPFSLAHLLIFPSLGMRCWRWRDKGIRDFPSPARQGTARRLTSHVEDFPLPFRAAPSLLPRLKGSIALLTLLSGPSHLYRTPRRQRPFCGLCPALCLVTSHAFSLGPRGKHLGGQNSDERCPWVTSRLSPTVHLD